jgi:hypothetical protein
VLRLREVLREFVFFFGVIGRVLLPFCEFLGLLFLLPLLLVFLRFQILPRYLILSDMIDHELSPAHLGPIHVIHGQHGRPLVFESKEGKTPRPAGLVVPGQPAVHYLTKLRECDHKVSLIHAIVEPSDEYICGIPILMMPRSVQRSQAVELSLSQPLYVLDFVHLYY